MSRIILVFGILAGVVAAVPMCLIAASSEHNSAAQSYFVGYLVLVLALSLIFFGVKRLRDRELGGVIRFVPALLAGLGISAVAGVIYVIGWEITLAVTDYAFIDSYSQAAIEAARHRRMLSNSRALADRGLLRAGVSVRHAADVMYALSSAEMYELLVLRRRWSLRRFGEHVREQLGHALLE